MKLSRELLLIGVTLVGIAFLIAIGGEYNLRASTSPAEAFLSPYGYQTTGLASEGLPVKAKVAPVANAEGLVEVSPGDTAQALFAEYPEARSVYVTKISYLMPTSITYWQEYWRSHVRPDLDIPNMMRHWQGYTSPLITASAMVDIQWQEPRLAIGRALIFVDYSYTGMAPTYHWVNIVGVWEGKVIWYIMDSESPRVYSCRNDNCYRSVYLGPIFRRTPEWMMVHLEM